MVKIESGIPMPEGRLERVKYPYGEMGVGDSFMVEKEGKNVLAVVCNRNGAMGKKLGRKFKAKKVEGGVRVWRVE